MSQLETKGVTALVANASDSASSIIQALLTLKVGMDLDSFLAALPSYLADKGGLATLMKGVPIENVDNIIESELWNDYTTIIAALKAGIVEGVGGLEASLFETAVGASALMQSYRGLVQRLTIDPYISRWANRTYTPNIPDAETTWFMKHVGAITEGQYSEWLLQNGWSPEFNSALDMTWTRQPAIDIIFDLRRRGKIDDGTVKTMLNWFRFDPATCEKISGLYITYPEPYRMAEMHSKAIVSNDELLSVTRNFGLEDKWALSWAEGQLRYPDFTTALALLRRGEISEETFYFWMMRGQVEPETTETLLKLRDVIPPIDDLIRFAVREAFPVEPGLPQFQEMEKWAAKMGLSGYWVDKYWKAHFVRMGLAVAYDNYARGYFDKTMLEKYLLLADVHPDDWKAIEDVAFLAPSIREQGYGYDVGVYSLEDIEKYARWRRLSPEDAKKSATAMVAYRTEAERNAVRTEYVYAYGRGALTADDLLAKLTEIKTPAEAIPLWMERADLYRERIMKPEMDTEGKLVSSSEALTAFKLGLRTEDWLREALKALDWIPERIDVAVERAKLELEEKEREKEEVKYRKLTLAQIRQLYFAHRLTKDEVTTEIVLIGYSPENAELLTEIYTREEVPVAVEKPYTSAVAANMYALAMFDEDDLYDNFRLADWTDEQASWLTVYTVLSQKYPTLRNLYAKGVLSTVDFVKELQKIEVPEFEAWQLVKKTYEELQYERLSVERDLTKSEIIKGVKNNVLTPSQGAEMLQDIGYDESEAWYILAINKVVAAGDPDGYWEMRRVTEAYKKAKGEKALEIPDELIMLERELKNAKAKLDELKKTPEKEEEIKEALLAVNSVEQRMREVVGKLVAK